MNRNLTPPVRRWASVVSNRRVAGETFWVELECPEIASASRPGQFVMVGLGLAQVGAPFLPRPFSVGWRASDGRVGLLLRVFGSGTRRLSEVRAGDRLLLLGPLGRGFRLDPGQETVCLAGGVGLAPFIFLLAEHGAVQTPLGGRPSVRLLYGERSAERVFDPDLLERLTGSEPEIWTEDGSLGRRGRVLEGIAEEERPLLLGCGPTPMLSAVAELARHRGLDAQVSVEEYMGCGVGTCQGCVVPGADGSWIKSCTEGPVFDVRELAWGGVRAGSDDLTFGG